MAVKTKESILWSLGNVLYKEYVYAAKSSHINTNTKYFDSVFLKAQHLEISVILKIIDLYFSKYYDLNVRLPTLTAMCASKGVWLSVVGITPSFISKVVT